MKRVAEIAWLSALVLGSTAACTGGSGPIPQYDDNYDSRSGFREPSGAAREPPPYNNERPGIDRDRPRPSLTEPPPGLKVGGSSSVTQTGSFRCSGVYVCKGSDNDTDNISLSQSGGKCRAGSLTLEQDGSITALVGGRIQVLGSWSVSGDTLTLSGGQSGSTTCTPRASSSTGSSSGSSGTTITIDAGG